MIDKIEQHLCENMARYIICAMIGIASADKLLMHVPYKNFYEITCLILVFFYFAVIGILREVSTICKDNNDTN